MESDSMESDSNFQSILFSLLNTFLNFPELPHFNSLPTTSISLGKNLISIEIKFYGIALGKLVVWLRGSLYLIELWKAILLRRVFLVVCSKRGFKMAKFFIWPFWNLNFFILKVLESQLWYFHLNLFCPLTSSQLTCKILHLGKHN